MHTHSEYARQAFGLAQHDISQPLPCALPSPGPGECVAVVGPSGAGKTLALRALDGREVMPLARDDFNTPVLELFDPQLPSEQVLRTLARVGLADGRLWNLRAEHLSAGEGRRLEFALALCGHEGVLVADEFDAHLDAATACVLAENLQRLVRRDKLALVVSTHRPETLAYLQPGRVIRIDHGQAAEAPVPAGRTVLDEIEIVRGRLRDYVPFARWHYLGDGRPGPSSDVFLALHQQRPVGVIVFGYPHLLLAARRETLPEYAPKRIAECGAKGLNANVRLLQRVVVEPRFRGVGIAQMLIRHGLAKLTVQHVECVAQMGAFSDFLLASGFRRAFENQPPASARVLGDFLQAHEIPLAEMLDVDSREAHRARLAVTDRKHLDVLLRRLVNTRVQTGFGSLRGKPAVAHESVLRKALARLDAHPSYFLWTRETP